MLPPPNPNEPPPQPYQPQQKPPFLVAGHPVPMTKQMRVRVGLILAVVAAVGVIGYMAKHPTTGSGDGTHTVVYRTGGTADTGDVTMATPDGSVQRSNANTGGDLGSYRMADGDFLYISVQNSGTGGSTISCSVFVDGKQVLTNTATGEFAIATCSGRI